MNDLIRQIPEDSCCSISNNISSQYFSMEISKSLDNSTSTSCECKNSRLSDKTLFVINTLQSYKNLPDNWNGYGAKAPSSLVIRTAIEFVLLLHHKQRIPSLVIPTPDEGIVVELQEGGYRLEFIFNHDNTSYVTGYKENDLIFEHGLNETKLSDAIKWLIKPDVWKI
jgi:hypothetical protein